MDHIDKALNDIIYYRAKIREDFVKAYLAYNVKDVTREVFNTLIIVEQTVAPGTVTFKVMTQKEFDESANGNGKTRQESNT